jgi:hypothetical protein
MRSGVRTAGTAVIRMLTRTRTTRAITTTTRILIPIWRGRVGTTTLIDRARRDQDDTNDRGQTVGTRADQKKDETIMVLSGRIELEHFGESEPTQRLVLGPLEPFRIRPGMRHRVTALEDTDIVEVSTTETDDVVRLDDRYGRVGG